jgi:hypothetical protein
MPRPRPSKSKPIEPDNTSDVNINDIDPDEIRALLKLVRKNKPKTSSLTSSKSKVVPPPATGKYLCHIID